jgi:hypothetical protein
MTKTDHVRTKSAAAVMLAGALLPFGTSAITAPSKPVTNDEPSTAQVLARVPGKVHENTSTATLGASEPQTSCVASTQTVWFAYTPDVDTDLEIDTGGSTATGGDYDTVLGIYTYDGSGYVEVTCNDDSGVDPRHPHLSQVFFTAFAGVTYYIQVGSYDDTVYENARLSLRSSIVVP